jgi:hypothetical protein
MLIRRLHFLASSAVVLATLPGAAHAQRAGEPPAGPPVIQGRGWRAFVGCWSERAVRFELDSLADPRTRDAIHPGDARRVRVMDGGRGADGIEMEPSAPYWRLASADSIELHGSSSTGKTIRHYSARGDSLTGRIEYVPSVATGRPNPWYLVRAWRIPCPRRV